MKKILYLIFIIGIFKNSSLFSAAMSEEKRMVYELEQARNRFNRMPTTNQIARQNEIERLKKQEEQNERRLADARKNISDISYCIQIAEKKSADKSNATVQEEAKEKIENLIKMLIEENNNVNKIEEEIKANKAEINRIIEITNEEIEAATLINEKLFSAVQNRDLTLVKKLLEEGADINCTDREGFTLLMRLLEREFDWDLYEWVDFFIKNGVDINILNNKGENVLIFLLEQKKEFLIDFDIKPFIHNLTLEKLKSLPEFTQEMRDNLFPYIVAKNDVEIIEWLLKKGISQSIITIELHNLFRKFVLIGNYSAILELLLSHKGDYNINKRFGYNFIYPNSTCLIMVIASIFNVGNDGIIENNNLAAQMCRSLIKNHGADVNITNENGDSPLLFALRMYNLIPEVFKPQAFEIIKLLLEEGSDIDIVNKEGKTFVDYIENDEIQKLVDDIFNEYSKNTLDSLDYLPLGLRDLINTYNKSQAILKQKLIFAIKNVNLNLIKNLIRMGVDITNKDETGDFLFVKIFNLARAQVDANPKDENVEEFLDFVKKVLESLLIENCKQYYPLFVQKLIDLEVNPNCTDQNGFTPLMHLAKIYHDDIYFVLDCLLACKANLNQCNTNGDTALTIALKYNINAFIKRVLWALPDDVEILKSLNLDLQMRNNLIPVIIDKGNFEQTKWLLEQGVDQKIISEQLTIFFLNLDYSNIFNFFKGSNKFDQLKILELLLHYKGHFDLNDFIEYTYGKRTPLEIILNQFNVAENYAEGTTLNLCQLLLNYKINLNKKFSCGDTPLIFTLKLFYNVALGYKSQVLKIIEFLLDNGADINIENNDGRNFMHYIQCDEIKKLIEEYLKRSDV